MRLLSFEEPASRFARMLKLLARYPLAEALRSGSSLSASESRHSISLALRQCRALFGSNDSPLSAGEMLALALALDDLRLFSNTAMLGWYGRYWSNIDSAELAALSFDPLREDLLQQLSSGLSREAQAWLRTALWTALDLDALAGATHEKLAAFMGHCRQVLPVSETVVGVCEPPNSADALAQAQMVRALSRSLVGKFRPELVLLVEGQTEAIVLPHVAGLLGVQSSLEVVASGGAQQVVRRYLTLKDSVRLPIVCVLDGDAAVSAELIDDALRPRDCLVSLAVRELEDAYGYEQLLEMLNRYLINHGQTLSQGEFELPRSGSRKDALKKMMRRRGLGDLDKIEFAHVAVACLSRPDQVPSELVRVMEAVGKALREAGGGVESC